MEMRAAQDAQLGTMEAAVTGVEAGLSLVRALHSQRQSDQASDCLPLQCDERPSSDASSIPTAHGQVHSRCSRSPPRVRPPLPRAPRRREHLPPGGRRGDAFRHRFDGTAPRGHPRVACCRCRRMVGVPVMTSSPLAPCYTSATFFLWLNELLRVPLGWRGERAFRPRLSPHSTTHITTLDSACRYSCPVCRPLRPSRPLEPASRAIKSYSRRRRRAHPTTLSRPASTLV